MSHSLSFKLSFSVGLIVLAGLAAGSWQFIHYTRGQAEAGIRQTGDGFVETVRRATYWSMLRNEREAMHRIIQDLAAQPGVLRIRVFNKEGAIMFSSSADEIGCEVDKHAEACYGCHAQDAPLARLPSEQRSRIFLSRGARVLGTILPIYNEPACSNAACHAHPPEQKVLGVLDVDLSLTGLDRRLDRELKFTLYFALAMFFIISTFIGLAIIATVNRSVNRLVTEVDKVSAGDLNRVEAVEAPDELGKIARAFNRMAESVARRTRMGDRRYRHLILNSTDAVILLDRGGRILLANPEAAGILGLEQGSLEGRNVAELAAPQDLEPVRAALAEALEGRGPTDLIRFRVVRGDSKIRVLEGRFRRLEGEDGEVGVLANLRDITRSQALEAELDRRRAFEQKLIHQALNAILATDSRGVVQIFNESAEELLGVSAEEVINTYDYTSFFPRAQVRLLRRMLFDSPREGASLVRPAVVRTLDGRRLPVMLSARVLFMGGEFSGVMLFLQNLRESKALKAQLLRKTRLAAVGQTAAGLAHCMKNLLHGLGSAAYLVDQGLDDGDLELAKQGWRMVKRNMDQVEGLTQDLLSYARDRRPQYQPFNLNQMLSECAALAAGRAQEMGVDVKLRPDPSCKRVILDPFGIRRVILNLLTNSLDALAEHPPAQGTPTVTLADGRDGAGMVWVSVSDNGPGLPPEVKKNLFSGLFTTKGSKGTGLGLLVSQKIVEEHGGAIECVNLHEGGVRFTLAVPDLSETNQAKGADAG